MDSPVRKTDSPLHFFKQARNFFKGFWKPGVFYGCQAMKPVAIQ